ncbi:MAG TPA: MFS transporter, partial [Herpetosiphonaceae bacterium]|nr:MFS transporter [Herpetosiphonaceae bacterium]
LEVTGSPAILGNILAVAMLARAGWMLLGGVVVDRVSPRRVMVAINALRAVLGAMLTAFVLLDLLAVWHLYVFAFAFGLLDAFFQPAFLAIPPLLVASDELPPANAVLQATRRACDMLGPALGGVLLKVSGAGAAFGADAVSFALAAILFARIRTGDQAQARLTIPVFGQFGAQFRRVPHELGQGLRHVGRDRVLRILVLVVAIVNLMLAGPLAVGLPTLARTRFAADPLAFGLLLSAFGGGALVGTLLGGVPQLSARWGQWIIGAIASFGICFLIVSRAPTALIAALAVALAGVGAGFVLVLTYTAFQQHSAPEMRGRTLSVPGFASLACAALSNALAGVVAARDAGLLFAIAGGLLLCTAAGFGLNRTVRGLK